MNDTYMTRETLLKRLKLKTDEEAWNEFESYYQAYIHAAINKMGISPAESDDLSQEILLKLWKALPDFDYNQKQGRFRNWLYTMIKNTVINYISHKNYQAKRQELLKVDMGGTSGKSEIDMIIDKEWKKHISALALKNISKQLSERAMDVFQSEIDGELTSVTAERLGVEENTIHVYRMRVRKSLVAEIRNLKEMLE